MKNKEQFLLLAMFSFIGILIAVDLITDFDKGVPLWHLIIEGAAGVLAAFGMLFVLKNMFLLREDLSLERKKSKVFEQEAELWQSKAKDYLIGLSVMIDAQLNTWKLTPAEKEVTFLLLKGFSLNDIAAIRGTREKTIRAHCSSIYAKAGLKSRSELAAFFLEDLLPANTQVT